MSHQKWLEWKENRALDVTSANGWLSVCGLFWLDSNGTHSVGSSASSSVVLPSKAPASIGSLRTTGDGNTTIFTPSAPLQLDNVQVEPHKDYPLRHDASAHSKATVVRVSDDVMFFIIKRTMGLGVRVKDAKNEKLTKFRGLEYFPYDERARVVARLTPKDKVIEVPNVLNSTLLYNSPGTLEFTWIDGGKYTLDPVLENEGAQDLFIIFKDATSNVDTYNMRFLHAPLPGESGEVELDLNEAYSPACMFTEYAACPLPPKQNVLPFRLEAGEKKYDGLH